MRDGGHATPLGELRCASCANVVNGAALGAMAGGGIGGAVAGPGILRWISEALHPAKKRERLERERAEAAAAAEPPD